MTTVGLLVKKRGNFSIQEKFIGAENVVDETHAEIEHHERALVQAGYSVHQRDDLAICGKGILINILEIPDG